MEDGMQINNVSPNHFFRFPSQWAFDGTLAKMSNPAMKVFSVLGAHANWGTGECFLSLNTISKESGYSRRSVIYGIHELESFSAVVVDRREGRANRYILAHYRNQTLPTLNPQDGDDYGGGGNPNGTDTPPQEDDAQPVTEHTCDTEDKIEDNAQLELQLAQVGKGQNQVEESNAPQSEPPQEDQADNDLPVLRQTGENNIQVEPQKEQEPVEEVSEPEPEIDDAQDDTLNTNEVSQEDTLHKDEVVQEGSPTSAMECITPCTQLHLPVQQAAPKQKNKKPDRISGNKNTAPKSEEWYKSLSTESKTSVLCCTRGISNVFATTFGQYIPAPIIMEKLMEGYEPQFLMDIIRHANVPMPATKSSKK